MSFQSKRLFVSFAVAGVAALAVLATLRYCITPQPPPWPSQLPNRTFIAGRVYNQPFGYLINQETLCRGNSTGLNQSVDYLFLITSAPDKFDQRNAIRNTWGRDVLSFAATRLAFMLGARNDPRLQSAIEIEASEHGDVIQEAFFDTYRNLTLKSVMMLSWTARFCPGARFVVKVDDDMYLNAGNFFSAMQSLSGDAVYGKLFHMTKPIRDINNKYYLAKEEFPMDRYPDYVMGSSYVIGGSVVDALYRATGLVRPFPIEDAYITGSCAESVGVRRVHIEGFNSLGIESLCKVKRAITVHRASAEEMITLRNQLPQKVCVDANSV